MSVAFWVTQEGLVQPGGTPAQDPRVVLCPLQHPRVCRSGQCSH